ncbi:ABC transporter permease subunit [Nocardioides convexus]|uniref:ABC transporter permease n=1 Tax=Nocardioides convexus TaxID=2712224 RepID=UPI002418A1B2|nr:ABC transporter permease subunit [Nocardioides convexus]
MWDFIVERREAIAFNTYQHALLVAEAVLLATLIGVALAVLVTRVPRLSTAAGLISAVGLTLPSFALIGLLLPVASIGPTTALIAVTFYAVLPILRNAVTGLQGVDPALLESARGMGLSEPGGPVAGAPAAGLAGDPRRHPHLDPDVDGRGRDRRLRARARPGRLHLHRPDPDRRRQRRPVRRGRHRGHRDRRSARRPVPAPAGAPDDLEGGSAHDHHRTPRAVRAVRAVRRGGRVRAVGQRCRDRPHRRRQALPGAEGRRRRRAQPEHPGR